MNLFFTLLNEHINVVQRKDKTLKLNDDLTIDKSDVPLL